VSELGKKHNKFCMCVWVMLVTENFAILGEMVTRKGEDRMKKTRRLG